MILAVFDILKGRSRFNTLVIKTVMTDERQGMTPENLKRKWSFKKPQPVIQLSNLETLIILNQYFLQK